MSIAKRTQLATEITTAVCDLVSKLFSEAAPPADLEKQILTVIKDVIVPLRDTEAPKKPRAAKAIFAVDVRPDVRLENKELKAPAINQIIAQKWNDLDEKERAVYTAKAEADKERYAAEMKVYVPPTQAELRARKAAKTAAEAAKNAAPKRSRNKTAPTGPQKPKKPATAYKLFMAEQKESGVEQDAARDAWKNMSTEQKQPYADQNKALMETYEEQKQKWNAEHPDDQIVKRTRITKKKKEEMEKSAIMLFGIEKMTNALEELSSGANAQEVEQKLEEMWAALSDDEKKQYYSPVAPADEEKKTSTKKRASNKKGSDGPKRPLSSYVHYCNEQRPIIKAANPEIKFGEIAKEISESWKKLSTDEKQKYKDLAAEDKARYQREIEAYVSSTEEEKKEEKVASVNAAAPRSAAAAEPVSEPEIEISQTQADDLVDSVAQLATAITEIKKSNASSGMRRKRLSISNVTMGKYDPSKNRRAKVANFFIDVMEKCFASKKYRSKCSEEVIAIFRQFKKAEINIDQGFGSDAEHFFCEILDDSEREVIYEMRETNSARKRVKKRLSQMAATIEIEE